MTGRCGVSPLEMGAGGRQRRPQQGRDLFPMTCAQSSERLCCFSPCLADLAYSVSMPKKEELVCEIRYKLDMTKLSEFEAYARAWMTLIKRHGGTHHGYYMPCPTPEGAGFSFSQIGTPGPTDEAVALFSFPDEESYHRYRTTVANDPDCGPAANLYSSTKCFISYERLFLKPLSRTARTS